MSRARRFTIVIGTIVSAVLLSSCMPQAPVAEEQTASVVVVLPAGEEALNPYSVALSQRRLGRLVFQGLLGIGEDLAPEPDLCAEVPTTANGGISEDGRTITYRLREARFHDGVAVTSADVVFTVDLLRAGVLVDEPGIDPGVIESVSAPDPTTVVVKLRRPDAGLAWRLAPYVLPRHLLEDSPDVLSDPFWIKPVGSGRYAVESVVPGVEVKMSRASGTGDGPDSIVAVFVADDAQAREVFDSEPHVIWPDATVQPAGAGESLSAVPSVVWWRAGAVLRDGSPIVDGAVREASRLCIESSLRSAAGSADATSGPYGFEVPAAGSPEESLSRAAEVLDRAGWKRSRDGIRRRGGKRLSLQVKTPALQPAEGDAWDAIRAAAATAGIEFEVAPGGPGYYGDFHDAGTVAEADADVFVTASAVGAPAGYAWSYSPADTPAFERPGALNWQLLDDRRLRRYTSEIRSVDSPRQAAAILRTTWDYLDDEDLVYWFYPEPAVVLVKRVGGVGPHPVPTEALSDTSSWSIER